MLRSLKSLKVYSIQALDGDLGKLERLFFDDDKWLVRYLVVKTGRFFSREKVLISTNALKKIDWPTQRFEVSLTKTQIEKSPDIDTDRPVSREKEIEYFNYYRWPYYWTASGIWGVAPMEEVPSRLEVNDPHLSSTHSALECKIEAMGAAFGKVEDLLIDDDHWFIRYLVVDSGNLREDRHMLIPTDLIESVDWSSRVMSLDLPLDFIKQSPSYHPPSNNLNASLSRDFEQKLRAYFHKIRKVS